MQKNFKVYKDGAVAGKIIAIINPDMKYKGYKVGLCGYYECIDDNETAKQLFDQVSEFHRKNGVNYLIGPMNGSTWQSYRVTEPPVNIPFFLDNKSENWHKDQFVQNGFEIIAKYFSTKIQKNDRKYKRIEKFKKVFSEKGIRIRSINLKDFEADLRKIYDISIKSFKNNFLYTPVTYEEFSDMYIKAKDYVDPEFVLLAENESEAVGFIFAVDDLLNKNQKALIIKSLAVVPGSQSRGLGSILTEMVHKTAFENGYQHIIHALMYENNASRNILSEGTSVYQRYLLFGKEI